MPPTVLVTGDVVLDCHLYGSSKAGAPSFSQPGTAYRRRLGGAALTLDLLQSSFKAAGKDWVSRKNEWEKTNEELKAYQEPYEWPRDISKLAPELDAYLGVETSKLEISLPTNLQSYGVWTDRAQERDGNSKTRVWRVERDFGYGPLPTAVKAVAGNAGEVPFAFEPAKDVPRSPLLTVIDDGALLFRRGDSKAMWRPFARNSSTYYLLKMSKPLCRGALWTELQPVLNRLIVIVSADDLRREDIQVSRRLSWEQCVDDTLDALENDDLASTLAQAAHVIINFESAGALWVRRTPRNQPATLVFDPVRLEGDFDRRFEGNVYGRQSCLTVGVAYHLLAHHAGWNTSALPTQRKSPFSDADTMARAMEDGLKAGLGARRKLLEIGHGVVGQEKGPGFPLDELGNVIFKVPAGFQTASVPPASQRRKAWTFLETAEAGAPASKSDPPLLGLAELAAIYGADALSHVPALRMGRLFTVDRTEVESLRTLEGLIRDYESVKVQKKPLSIGVFGPPGAGKSFGVRAMAEGVLGEKVPFLEFNLSQFKSPDELVGALHRVRDAVLTGITPVAFWDEFDSQDYKWLQYLLAPMQDGAFQEREITHPLGKCIFVFAGGTSSDITSFGVQKPVPPTATELRKLAPRDRGALLARVEKEANRFERFTMLKGPDFISRLHGFLNVLGPSPQTAIEASDIGWPVRRARLLRTLIGMKDGEWLDIDRGLLRALLGVPSLAHGARSLEKIVGPLVIGRINGRIHRAALPPDPVLARETNVGKLKDLLRRRNALRKEVDVETLAAAIHSSFLASGKRSKRAARTKKQPHLAWRIDPSILHGWDGLPEDGKEANRAAARRIPDHLDLIDFEVTPRKPRESGAWKATLAKAIEHNIDLLARAEHLGWCAERTARGWTYAPARNNDKKQHHLLTNWANLTPADQDKDRKAVLAIPGHLEVSGYKATPIVRT